MLSLTPWMLTAIAVALAVLAACGFASAAFLQQHAVARASSGQAAIDSGPSGRVSLTSFRWLLRQPRWLAGWGLMAAATALHVTALVLAPISVIQPIGILAVPVAVVLAARATRTWPASSVVLGVALSVAGTAAFVLLASGSTSATDALSLSALLPALLVAGALVAGFGLVAWHRSGLARCLGYAGIGAVCFGFGSALTRLIGRTITAEWTALFSPLVLIAALSMVSALVLGAWAVQQAYASGAAAVVTGTLTVGDPLVAILLSTGLLGEGLTMGPLRAAALVACALVAAAGVRLLAFHHPAGPATRAAEPTEPLTPNRQLGSRSTPSTGK